MLHDVGLREGDAQVGEFGHLVGEALVGGDEAWVGRGGRSVDDVVGHATGEAPVCLVHVAVQHEGCEQRLPHVPVLLDRTKLPVIVCARHVRVDVDGAQLSAELVIEGGVAIKPAGVDGDLETHAHEVAVGFECRHSRGHSLIADVLLVHPSAGRVTEAEDAGGTTTFSRSEAALPVADADRGRDRATSVFAWFAARTSHRGDRYEEAVRYGESIHAHLGRRGKSQSAVGDLEAHAREAVVPDPFEMRRRLVAKQSPAGADSGVRRRRGGGGAVEVLGDGFAHRVHADALGAQADVPMRNLRRERVDQGGRQALDAQQLAGSALAAAIDASPIVEDPGSVGSEAGAGAVDGVASLPAVLGAAEEQEFGATVGGVAMHVDCGPLRLRGIWRRDQRYRTEKVSNGLWRSLDLVGDGRQEWSPSGVDILASEDEVGAAPALAASEPQWVQVEELGYVPSLVAFGIEAR